ncbi:MAG: chemotaxis protein, partial [Candidatus Scalindua rubra]
MEAKLIGGANMFTAFKSNIGKETVLSAKEKLKKEGVNLIGEVVGGSQGRSVEFCIASGIVTVKMYLPNILWEIDILLKLHHQNHHFLKFTKHFLFKFYINRIYSF